MFVPIGWVGMRLTMLSCGRAPFAFVEQIGGRARVLTAAHISGNFSRRDRV